MPLNTMIELLRNAEGAGGGAAAQAATPPGPPAAAGAAAAPPAQDPGQAQGGTPAAAADYWPEGLDQQLRGADMNATLDNVAKVVKGYRDRDATRDVPEKPEGYTDFDTVKDFKIDPKNQPFFDVLKEDPAFKAMAGAMHKHGLGRAAALDIYQTGLNAMSEAGLLEPMLDTRAEMAALVPETARNAPEAEQRQQAAKRMQENFDFLKLMETNRQLPGEVREYAEAMLGDAARGHRFIEWVRGLMQQPAPGGGGAPAAAGGTGGVTRESLRAELAALNQGDPDYARKSAEIDAKYQKFFS